MNNKLTIKALNHVALQISDIEVSRLFYSQILNLQEIRTPDFDYPVIWFDLGEGKELHLIARKPEKEFTPIRSNHFAMAVSDIKFVERYLIQKGIKYLPIKSRPDGVLQLFLNDPDGNFIELCQF
ncbi:hypothetical protein EMA8858_00281 [Emticicia aquatica]|uniref:VOC domain-containing protein n=1 Tax=Emticicia aquatica TaxID=1681835 RepID=A0ABM9ALQ3_9BACT|nr:VOC family protein [Emticicia aquatica]CAH0994173.1 hypothetical protein EMA8858_00281 [Emticicia aquatica]